MDSLEDRFESFMLQMSSIENIDPIKLSTENRKQKKADYFALNRSLIIEQKTITVDQSDKIVREISKHENNDYFPVFFGEWNVTQVLKYFPKPDEVVDSIYTKITRVLEGYLSSANKQIVSTANIFKVQDYSGILVILNEKVTSLSPHIISDRISWRLNELKDDNSYRFEEIDYVILIDQTHLYKETTSGFIMIEGPNAKNNTQHDEACNYIANLCNSWATYNGGLVLNVNKDEYFPGIVSNHQKMKKDCEDSKDIFEAQNCYYKEKPYMRTWSNGEVLQAGALAFNNLLPYILKDTKVKASMELMAMMIFSLNDFVTELNYRGLDLRGISKYL